MNRRSRQKSKVESSQAEPRAAKVPFGAGIDDDAAVRVTQSSSPDRELQSVPAGRSVRCWIRGRLDLEFSACVGCAHAVPPNTTDPAGT